ncbi:FAD/NAD(P)-binding domain-containing protein [Polyplosphaeria fusca]|uniref:FAD/NAD(P)-binding domain-containing protein n=1 Tax=Polyplosphaeria fusca TaxID=682080 RepID=A0A9P4V7N6_9PLEO|nr:FAD/NAD(P)-binding domain-containing protein [Polyplosphaeria fusca]
MSENILIIGASFAGIGAAHYALKHVVPALPKTDGKTYTVTLVNPSKDFFWRIAAPRAVVSKTLMPASKILYPIEPGFKSYGKSFNFVLGTATSVDSAAQSVSITTASGEQQQIPYTALIIATGMATHSPLFTQTTDAASLTSSYDAFQKLLPSAKTIVIGGAGPVGVETAGEIAEALNGKPGLFASAPKNPKAKVTLVSAEKKMLPVLRESISQKADKYLKRLGVDIAYSTRVVSATAGPDGSKTKVELSDGKTIDADIYLDCTGGDPQTSWLPPSWLNERGKVAADPKTLRVPAAGPRVYVIGDAGSYTRGGVIDMGLALPVALTNLKIDLTAHISGKAATSERHYTADTKESQVCPIGTSKGVGAFGGRELPSIMVWMIKGRDYLVGQMAQKTVDGGQWLKETKYEPQTLKAAPQTAGLSSG